MSIISDLLSGGPAKIVTAIGDTIDRFVTTGQEREEFKLQLEKQLADEMAMVLKDVDSARNRELSINNSEHASWLAKNTVSIIALAYTAFNLIIYILVLTGSMKATENIQFLVINSISNIALLIVGYYFGSSNSGVKNRDVINDIARSKKEAQ